MNYKSRAGDPIEVIRIQLICNCCEFQVRSYFTGHLVNPTKHFFSCAQIKGEPSRHYKSRVNNNTIILTTRKEEKGLLFLKTARICGRILAQIWRRIHEQSKARCAVSLAVQKLKKNAISRSLGSELVLDQRLIYSARAEESRKHGSNIEARRRRGGERGR